MRVSHILFDFGGVVINHKVPAAIPHMFHQIADHYGVDTDIVIHFWHTYIDPSYMAGKYTYDDVVTTLESHFGAPLPPHHEDICIGSMGNAIFYQEIETFIYQLKEQGYTVGLLSDMPHEWKHIFKQRGWYKSFDVLFNSCDMGYAKVKDNQDDTTYMYDTALAQLGICGAQCLFIDDRSDNCAQAQKVGIQTIQAVSPKQTIEDVTAFLLA